MARARTVKVKETTKKTPKEFKPEITMVSTEELAKNLHPKNPRVHPEEAINKLVVSIEKYGWTNPVLVDSDGRVVAGHARISAAIKAKVTEIPVIKLPFNGKMADAYVIADNRLAEDTDWDVPLLQDMLETLSGDMNMDELMAVTGFDAVELDTILGEVAPEVREKKKKAKKPLTCPKCGHEFTLGGAEDDDE